jgi:hypothetical protein
MFTEQALQQLSEQMGLEFIGNNYLQLRDTLAKKINELINTDFSRLISMLYRVDVSEQKLKNLLKENPDTDAGILIADLMIERQAEKIKSRQQNQRDENISDEEKW